MALNLTEARNRLIDLPADKLLALMAYGEARGEPVEGQLAVMWAAMNRARIGGWYGKGIAGEGGVVLKPFQFSCFNENDPNLPTLVSVIAAPDGVFWQLFGIARVALAGLTIDPTMNSTNYHTIAAPAGQSWPPLWASRMEKTVTINSHVFYKEKIKGV